MLPIEIAGYRVEAHEVENARYTAPIWLVHGLWTGAWCWRAFGSFLAHRGWETLALDLRGRPDSRHATITRISFADYVDDVTTVLETRGGDRPILVGHDLGALVCLAASARVAARAVIALAPPFGRALRAPFRAALSTKRGLFRSRVPPPAVEDADALERERMIDESPLVAGTILGDGPTAARGEIPVLIVAGSEDPFLDPTILRDEAGARGFAFLERPARHWQLGGKGFERHVDLVHRWLVRELGGELLKLTGFEDLDEDGDESA